MHSCGICRSDQISGTFFMPWGPEQLCEPCFDDDPKDTYNRLWSNVPVSDQIAHSFRRGIITDWTRNHMIPIQLAKPLAKEMESGYVIETRLRTLLGKHVPNSITWDKLTQLCFHAKLPLVAEESVNTFREAVRTTTVRSAILKCVFIQENGILWLSGRLKKNQPISHILLDSLSRFLPSNSEERKAMEFHGATTYLAIQAIQHGNESEKNAGKELLLRKHQRFVPWFFNRIRRSMILDDPAYDDEDYIITGELGLLTAAEKFDCQRFRKFTTYASWWIRQAITRYNEGFIRIPVHAVEKLVKYRRALRQAQAYEEPEQVELLIQRFGISYAKAAEIVDLLKIQNHPTSLDSFTNKDEESTTLLDMIEGDGVESPELMSQKSELLHNVHELLETAPLGERSKEMLKLYFGIGYPRRSTLQKIGDQFRLTRERVRQIIEQALNDLSSIDKWKRLQGILTE